MTTGLRRYEFSERLADILGESRRDLRFRVTLLVSEGLIPPGPRGPGSPPADPAYAALLLIGAMAAPQQAQTVEAIRCYRDLRPTAFTSGETAPRVIIGPPQSRLRLGPPPQASLLLADQPSFGEALARLLDQATDPERCAQLAHELFGIWVSRGFPAAAVQLVAWSEGRHAIVTQRYEPPPGGTPPAWLDPGRGGVNDPGLLHSVFLPVSKLIAIGRLTTSRDERKPHVLDLGQTISDLAHLARRRGQRRPWEKFLEKASAARAFADTIAARSSHLSEVAEFGSNPGNLRMLKYVPEGLPQASPLVVVLHGCTQTGASIDYGVGWSTLADRYGFAVLLPEQRRRNNPLRCFNWFKPEDTERGQGEALSIRQMVQQMIADHDLDPARVYVTGLSAGGAMTSVMLATYPEVFAGGAVIAGVPYRCANGLQDGFDVIFQGRSRPAQEWGDLVRAASGHQGPWPKLSVWHGAADGTVKPINAEEIIKQWTHVHGVSATPTVESFVEGHAYRVWRDSEDNDIVECYIVSDMPHGAPIHPGDGEARCGTVAPFILDMGISSTHHIARFWGLNEPRPGWTPRQRTTPRPGPQPGPQPGPRHRPQPSPQSGPQPASSDADGSPIVVNGAAQPSQSTDDATAGGPFIREPGREPGPDLPTILAKSFEATGLLKRGGDSRQEHHEQGTSGGRSGDGDPLGIDIQSILQRSFQAAGLLKPSSSSQGRARETTLPFGIDLQQILETSFEAAGLLRSRGDDTGNDDSDNRGQGDLAGSGWNGEGWQLLQADRGSSGGAVLFGEASSGSERDVGDKVRTVSCRLTLGQSPRLSYARRLDLRAAVNMFTTATFRVLVDGEVVDEASAAGMDYAEADWTERADIDLARYSGRTVTLEFEVAAHSNVFVEAFARVWLRDVRVT